MTESSVTAPTCAAAGAQKQLVRQAVGHYGSIVSVTVPEAKEFCFVEFEDESQAQVQRLAIRRLTYDLHTGA
jgi:cobalamin biosynthesis protein CbiD